MGGGSGFGIDPYLIGNLQAQGAKTNNENQQSFSDMLGGMQQRQQQAYNFQRQRGLADLVSQNAGIPPDQMAGALMHGGYLQEAQAAQQQALQHQQMIQSMMEHTGTILRSRAAMVKTPAQAKQYLSGISPDMRSYLGLPDAEDPEALAGIQSFRQAAITPEEQAKNQIEAQKTAQEGYDVKEVDGTPYVVDKAARKAYPLNGAASAQGGETPAPVGSKRFTQKADVLKPLAEDLDPTSGKSDLAVKANSMIQASDRLHALAKAPGPVTPERLQEITSMAATIAAGGNQPTLEQIEGMLPQTLRGKGAKTWEYLTSNPTDAGAQKFISQLVQQSERETGVAKKQIRDYMLGRLAKHPQAFQSFPNEANQMAESAGLKGLYDPKTGTPIPRATVSFKGKTMTIPRSRLAEALKDGATEVK